MFVVVGTVARARAHQTGQVITAVDGWPVGEGIDDLAAYAMAQGAEGYDVHEVRLCRCAVCGGQVFGVHGDIEERAVQRICRD
ncbi:hypothetical protein ACFPIJ_32910 [Dactylosporangium cerinum]|uniref:PDZ domain-containing protein n=1 Tax=Dactylosporangium cerinum TaxID=1434730 RepID=A0ABV9W3R2_9ACTN